MFSLKDSGIKLFFRQILNLLIKKIYQKLSSNFLKHLGIKRHTFVFHLLSSSSPLQSSPEKRVNEQRNVQINSRRKRKTGAKAGMIDKKILFISIEHVMKLLNNLCQATEMKKPKIILNYTPNSSAMDFPFLSRYTLLTCFLIQ